ncbi:Protease synthase and sporulation negative regulatory protein PAI 1 [compost metagenome]
MTIQLQKCTLEDSRKLQEISVETFTETFKDNNSTESLNAYLERAYNLKKLEKELADSCSQFYFIYLNDEVAGYLKVNTDDAQSEKRMKMP